MWKRLLCVLLTISLVLGAKLTHKNESPLTVLQTNHFQSDKLTSKTNDINKLDLDLPLILILRQNQAKSISQNPIHITIISGSTKVQCNFKSYNSVCVMDKIPNKETKMEIKCDHLPCSVSWTIYQSPINSLDNANNLQYLYSVKKYDKHTILMISCNNPQFKQLQTSIQLYSNNLFTRTYKNNVIYYLFNNQQEGYLYFKMNSEVKMCAQLSVYSITGTMTPEVIVKDFVVNSEKSIFKINDIPKDAFRIDCSMHHLLKTQPVKSNLEVELTGEQNSVRKTIVKSLIIPNGEKDTFDFSYVVNKIGTQWKNIQFQFQSKDKMIMLNSQLSLQPRSRVERGQVSFMSLKKGEVLNFNLQKEENLSQDQDIYFIISNKTKLKAIPESCKAKTGCNFTVQALQDFNSQSIYINSQFKAQKSIKAVVNKIDRSVTKKIKEGDFMYFSKKINAKSSVQVVVNSPNVMIYASKEQKCGQPNQMCYQKIGNNHHSFIYQASQETNLIIGVLGLDNSVFTLTLIAAEDQFIKLSDGVGFSYEMDGEEKELVFKFTIKKKSAVSFNLISPLHSLNMFVSNSKNKPKDDQDNLKSIDGYIHFDKDDVNELQFTILVQKTQSVLKKTVHFSIIASTSGSNMILEPGVAHYQTLAKKQVKLYAFQFQKKLDYIVNFYVHNTIGQNLDIKLQVSNQDQDWTDKSVQRYSIDTPTDHLNLEDVSQKLCKLKNQLICEIFLRITNNMDQEIDMTLTLMVMESIIELKDGLWQSYVTNPVSSSTYFFFFPRHAEKSVNILYKSTFSDLRIGYTLWRAQDKSINPINWPFPKSAIDFLKQADNFMYSPTKHITISKQALKQCWPSCVVLISLIQDSKNPITALRAGSNQDQWQFKDIFTILVSNNIMQIPQKSKIDVILEDSEEKYFLIDLRDIVGKKAVTIFTSTTIGYPNLFASVYSQNSPRCPEDDQDSDFVFGRLQTQIKASTIEDIVKINKMSDDKNIYLCVMAKANIQTKFYIQWTSDQSLIKVLDLDSFETIKIEKGQVKTFQIIPRQEQYQLKFTRTRGFPIIQVTTCDGKDKDYDQCIENSKAKKKQMLTKTQLFSEPPCSNCLIFVRIQSEEPCQLDIHVQGKYSEVQIKENSIISDFTEKDESNLYRIVYLNDKQTVISIHVLEGDIKVQVTDFHDIKITKENSKVSGLIQIIIPPINKQKIKKDKAVTKADLGVTHYSSAELMSNLKYLHVTISSKSAKTATSYTINYSSGDRQVYLQDGLLLDYKLEPKKQVKFFYQNTFEKSHAFMTVSMKDSAALNALQLSLFYFSDPEDEDSKVELTLEKPPMRKHTPNPTIVYSLPSNYKLFSFVFNNPTQKDQEVRVAINHLEVILLPYDMEFPFLLAANETINFLVDVINTGYLKINIRKCDDSNPQFGYTFNENSFQKGEYQFITELSDDPSRQQIFKANQEGTLYMMMKSELEPSLLSIKVTYNDKKVKSNRIKAGGKGILQYQLLNSQQAQIVFSEVICDACSDSVKYQMISGTQMQSLYSQTVCPSSFFVTDSVNSAIPLNVQNITQKPDSNKKITFHYKLLDHVSYLSVKAVMDNGQEIFYRPIQIVTLWGQLSRTSSSHKFFMLFVFLVILCLVLVCVRRNARKGYRPLQQTE